MGKAQVRAREFLRVSIDKSGRERSPDEQHQDHLEVADERGWALHPEPYRAVGSVSKYARKPLAEYARLMADLEADRFDAEVLVLWESSRGGRRVGPWVTLIELLEDKGVLVYVHTHQRLYDPSNAHDRAALLGEAVKSELDSAQTSHRVRRTARSNAQAGRPHGRPPVGYTREYEYVTVNGRQVRVVHQVPKEPEATMVRELFERLHKGESVRAIERAFAEAGYLNGRGRPYGHSHLLTIAHNEAYMGVRVHDEGRSGRVISPDATRTTATWEPLVPPARFRAVKRMLTDPQRRTNRPGAARHLLSRTVVCDVCSGVVGLRVRRGVEEYTCADLGHVRFPKDALDDHVERVLLGYLSRPEVYAGLSAGVESAGEAVRAAEEAVEAVEAELRDLADQVGSGALSAALAARAEPAIRRRLDKARDAVKALRGPSALDGLIEPGPDVAERWKRADIAVKRQVVRILLTPELLGELRITRSPNALSRKKDKPEETAEERIVWRRTEG